MTLMDTTTPTNNPTTTAEWIEHASSIGAELKAEAASCDACGVISRPAFDRLRAEGVTSALVPIEFGGGGASHSDMGAILRTIASFDPAVGVTLAMHSHLVAFQVWRN